MNAPLWGLAAALTAWLIGGGAAAVVIGRAIRTADGRCCFVAHDDLDDEIAELLA